MNIFLPAFLFREHSLVRQKKLFYVSFCFFFLQVTDLDALPKHKAPQNEGDDVGAYWFLLPSEGLGLKKGQGREIRKLFSSADLDMQAILSAAIRHEQNFRSWIEKQQSILRSRLCRLSDKRAFAYVRSLAQEKQRQELLWENVRQSYGRSARAYFHQRKTLKKIDSNLLPILFKALAAFQDMQDFRQQEVLASWTSLLSFWQKNNRQEVKKICARGEKVKLDSPEFMRPYYLSFYRFLELLSLKERRLFLTHLHFQYSDK